MDRPDWAVVTERDMDDYRAYDGDIHESIQYVVDNILARMPGVS